MMRRSSVWSGGLGAALVLAAIAPRVALADVRREGAWPASDTAVTLDFDGVPRGEALNRLAKAAGWSIVVTAPKGDPVNLHVANQPAGKVLDLLLADDHYVARRDGALVAIAPAGDAGAADEPPPAPPAPPPPPAAAPAPPVPPAPPTKPASADDDDDDGLDRTVTGGSLRIEKGEVVHDVTVMGGNVDVWGTVSGDLAVMGGNVRIHRGAHVKGDAALIGGTLRMDTETAIDGDVHVLGGKLERDTGAKIGGEVQDGIQKVKEHRTKHSKGAGAHEDASRGSSLARRAADAVNGAALLFVFGAVLLALMPARMDKLRLQIAAHPMRTFATGVVSLIGGIALFCAACVTLIGIPVAVVGLLAAVIATFAGVCSVLETVGGALLAHRTKNPYVHLAFGGLLFLVAGAIPYVGGLVKLVVVLTAIGSVVATRGAGLFPAKLRGASPYRDAANA